MIPSDRVSTGLNFDLGSYRDDRYTRCAKCGFIVNLDRHTRAGDGSHLGYGIDLSGTTFNSVALTGNAAYSSVTVAVVRIDPVITGGCPMCGTYRYNK